MNADQAVALGKQQCEEFEAGWPVSFHDTISRVVNPMSVSDKFIDVGHSKYSTLECCMQEQGACSQANRKMHPPLTIC